MLLIFKPAFGTYPYDAANNQLLLPPTNANATEEASNYLICERSGFRVRVDEGLKTEWNGLMVRAKDWERRQPQDFVRSIREDKQGSIRPEAPDRTIAEVFPNGVTQDDL